MRRVLIVGAGGFAEVVADMLLRLRDSGEAVEPVGYLDDNRSLYGKTMLGLPVLGDIASLSGIPHDSVVITIGNNRVRNRIFEQLKQQGQQFATVIHPSAIIPQDVSIGEGSIICGGVVLNTGTIIGSNTILSISCAISHHNHIGSHTHIGPGVNLCGGVTIGEGTLVGAGAVATPLCRVGSWSTVGAGAVVIEDIPDQVVAVGSPAKVIKHLAVGHAVNGSSERHSSHEGESSNHPGGDATTHSRISVKYDSTA
jgi:sugar O-acyltransferase (sialic acid O-acetyltransferase NeuD family)